ncbi:MAG: tetratricopeptide repeat protein [Deltaproteobacteria bacterium]|nr:tetratricopeptide repeat protein [Deltaproteobacteria bacterium]
MVALVVVVLAPSAAHADVFVKPTNADALQRLGAGNRLYRMREFERAADEYKAGALAEDVPLFHYNLGQCFRQLGKYEDAIWHYERFLDRVRPTGEVRDAIDGFVRQMKDELLAKAKMQQPAPDAHPVEPKDRIVLVERSEPWYRDTFGWGLAGTGTIGVGASLGFVLHGADLDRRGQSEMRQEVRNELHAQASRARLAGTIIGVVGGAALVVGIVKLVVHPRDRVRAVARKVGVSERGVLLSFDL